MSGKQGLEVLARLQAADRQNEPVLGQVRLGRAPGTGGILPAPRTIATGSRRDVGAPDAWPKPARQQHRGRLGPRSGSKSRQIVGGELRVGHDRHRPPHRGQERQVRERGPRVGGLGKSEGHEVVDGEDHRGPRQHGHEETARAVEQVGVPGAIGRPVMPPRTRGTFLAFALRQQPPGRLGSPEKNQVRGIGQSRKRPDEFQRVVPDALPPVHDGSDVDSQPQDSASS